VGAKYVGAIVRRQEDPRYLTGRGRFVDDLAPAGCLHAAVLRSLHAHARIAAIRAGAARAWPGVAAVFTFDNLTGLRPIPEAGVAPPPLKARVGFQLRSAQQYPLARDKVRYVGEPVAVVVADDRYAAEDALGLIGVAYEPLPVCASVADALAPGATGPERAASRGAAGGPSRRSTAAPASRPTRASPPTPRIASGSPGRNRAANGGRTPASW